jgi:hypothetical protein
MTAYLNTETNEYPRHIGDLYLLGHKDGEEIPAPWVTVTPTDRPEVPEYHYPKETFPVLIDGTWLQQWEIIEMTPEEIEAMKEATRRFD